MYFACALLFFSAIQSITASAIPQSSTTKITASSAEQSAFLNNITNYLYHAYELIEVTPKEAKPLIQALEHKVPVLVDILNANLINSGLEQQNTTDLVKLSALAGTLTLGQFGGYLEAIAGRVGGVTAVPQNVTNITLAQAASGVTGNPPDRRLRLRDVIRRSRS